MWLVYFLKGIKTGGRGLTLSDNNVGRLLRLISEVVLQYLLCARRVAKLGVEGSARVMRYHAVSATDRVLHRAPWVVLRGRLDIPDITSIAVDLTALDGSSDSVLVADRATRGVDEPCALLEVLEQLLVHEPARPLVQRAVDGDDVALRDEVF